MAHILTCFYPGSGSCADFPADDGMTICCEVGLHLKSGGKYLDCSPEVAEKLLKNSTAHMPLFDLIIV